MDMDLRMYVSSNMRYLNLTLTDATASNTPMDRRIGILGKCIRRLLMSSVG